MDEYENIKRIPGFNDYGIKEDGMVYSFKYGKIKPRKQNIVNGYQSVSLEVNGKGFQISIHRLLALAFIPNPENKAQVNHIDGNKLNNNLSNLEWATRNNAFGSLSLNLILHQLK